MSSEVLILCMFLFIFMTLFIGFPVAFTLSGASLIFALIGHGFGHFDLNYFFLLPERIYGVFFNEALLAVPLFVFMGMLLERSKISERLLLTMSKMFGSLRGGLGISVCLVGGLLAASTGIVGATVVTMGLISLPAMLRSGYSPRLATGIICASGTLGQIIPPSVVLVILGDVLSSSYQKAQLSLGNFAPDSVSVGDLFIGAIIPGSLLMVFYILYVLFISYWKPERAPTPSKQESFKELWPEILAAMLPALSLIILVLGSILGGIATPTEAASVGVVGALFLALYQKKLHWGLIKDSCLSTLETTAMVYTIFFGASVFSLVFRGLGGDDVIHHWFDQLGGGVNTAIFVVMVGTFLLGCFLDFFEIIFVMVPIVGPVLMKMGVDPVWLGVLLGINLQTSFLTPPFGFSLFYLRGVAPASVRTIDIYKGVIPFVLIQIAMLVLLQVFPEMVTWYKTLEVQHRQTQTPLEFRVGGDAPGVIPDLKSSDFDFDPSLIGN